METPFKHHNKSGFFHLLNARDLAGAEENQKRIAKFRPSFKIIIEDFWAEADLKNNSYREKQGFSLWFKKHDNSR